MDYSAQQIASGMRRLNRQICTPPGFDRGLVEEITRRGLMQFHEWPSGHWAMTDRGRDFLIYDCADNAATS